jgi:hypothetical protein
MAEPIVRTFEIDTAKSEQNLRQLGNAFDSADNSGKSLKAQLRELQAQLANTDPQTQKYRDLSQAAGELKDKIQDAAQAVGTQAGGAFEKVSGSLGLVTSRIASLDFEGAAEGAKLLAQNIGQINFDDIATGALSLADSLFDIGKSLLKNPLFYLGAAIAGIVIYYEELDQAIRNLNPELERQRQLTADLNEQINAQAKQVGTQITQVNALFNAVTDLTKADSEREKALQAIQTLYPDVFKNQNIDINNTDALTNAKLTLIQAIEAEAKATAAKNLLEQQYAKQFELQVKLQQSQALLSEKQAKEAEIINTSSRKTAAEIQQFTTAIVQAGNATANAAAEVSTLQNEIATNAKNIADIEKIAGTAIVDNIINNANKKVESNSKANEKIVEDNKFTNEKIINNEKEVSDLLNKLYEENVKEFEEAERQKTKAAEEEAAKRKKAEEDYDAAIKELRAQQDAANLTQDQLEIIAIDNKYLTLREKAIQAGQSTVEVDALYKQALLDQETASAQRRIATEKEVQQSKIDFAKQTLDGIATITSFFGSKSEADAKRAFKIQKAISIAQATISTYESANAIFASTAASPITALFPAAPFVAAGVAVAAGLANVATIASQQFQGSTTPPANNTPPPPSLTGGGGGDNGTQPAQFNPLAAQFVNNRPDQYTPRAYVLAGDVSSQQEVRENVEDLARIG